MMTNYDVLMDSTEEECCKLPEEKWISVDTTFLGSACGTVNFLVEILERKFKLCKNWEDGLRALKSIHAMNIQRVIAGEAKLRLFRMYIKQYPDLPEIAVLKAAQIVENNIVCGDFIKEYKDE